MEYVDPWDRLAAFEADAQQRERRALEEKFSFARVVSELLAGDGLRDGPEAELCREAAGPQYDVLRPTVPWGVLRRDMTAAGDAYLVGTSTLDAVDVLRPWSVTLQAGVVGLPGLQGNIALPRATASSVAFWLADENSAISASQPTLGVVSLTPKRAGTLIRFTHQMRLATPSLDAHLRRELLRTMGTLVDAAVLNGSSVAGQPTGVTNTPDVGTESGTSLAWAGICSMLEQVAAADATDANVSFVATPGVRELLQQREQATGSGLIWQGSTVAGKRASVTTDMPSGTLICGDFSQAVLGVWGSGITIAINPYDTFSTGIVAMRAQILCDVGLTHAGAFCVASSVT